MVKAVEELVKVAPGRDTALTIGVFDGVHLGHQHLISELRKLAERHNLLSGVATFEQHPQAVLAPQAALTYLTSLEERVELIRGLGVGLVVVLPFTRQLSQLSAREFVRLMQEKLRMRALAIGPDFALGRGREGDAAALAALAQELDFTLEVVPPLVEGGEVVSSSAVREALTRGDMARAARLLGRYFTLRGRVVRGVERGKTLGFPTANLALSPERTLPADGVYVTRTYLNETMRPAVSNIGTRPTFGKGERTVEVYLLDFEGALYGEELTIELWERLRPELRFDSVEELKAQMGRDVERAREIMS